MMDHEAASPGETADQTDVRVNKDLAAFSYVWIMSVVIYFSRKDSKFIQYHSKQGIVLFLISIPLSFLPVIGKYLMFVVVAGMLLGFLNAASGQTRDVPIAGPLSRGEMSLSDLLHVFAGLLKKLLETLKHLIKRHTRRNSEVSVPATAADVAPSLDKK